MAIPLPPEKIADALRVISAWRLAPETAARCPLCRAPGLSIIDQSARPYAEWYALSCKSCGLEQTINIPLGTPLTGGPD